jgi:hypothetical protein
MNSRANAFMFPQKDTGTRKQFLDRFRERFVIRPCGRRTSDNHDIPTGVQPGLPHDFSKYPFYPVSDNGFTNTPAYRKTISGYIKTIG